MKNLIKIVSIALIFAIFGVAGFWYWQHLKYNPSTDDAYVQAHVTHVAAQISGPVASVAVKEHQFVHAHQLLFTINQQPFEIAVQQAQAQLDLAMQNVSGEKAAVEVAKAQLTQAKAKQEQAAKQAKRIDALVKQGHVSKSDADDAKEALQVANAAVTSAQNSIDQAIAALGDPGDHNAEIQNAKAGLATAKLNLEHTNVYAPIAGKVNNVKLSVGDMVGTQQQLFSIIQQQQWWVNANYKETQLQRIRVGQTADVVVDMYPNHVFKGKVESISSGSGEAFSLLPPENATGNWVKVTQRFPVKITLSNDDKNFPLRVGASATVSIHTK